MTSNFFNNNTLVGSYQYLRILQANNAVQRYQSVMLTVNIKKNNLPFSSSMLRVIAVGVTRARVDVVCVIKYIMKNKKVHIIVEDNCGQVKSIVLLFQLYSGSISSGNMLKFWLSFPQGSSSSSSTS
uniref:Uncharacterized protein n=1 Tax=Glossina palpalis gambiensis TaxID=67801 RepID=A0A1B0BVN7_9MUSC